MSLGTEMGPHDGTSLRDIMADEMAGEGRILSVPQATTDW